MMGVFIAVFAQFFGDFVAVHDRHHHVQNDYVVIVGARRVVTVFAVVFNIDRVAVYFQALLNCFGDSDFIIYYQDFHTVYYTFLD